MLVNVFQLNLRTAEVAMKYNKSLAAQTFKDGSFKDKEGNSWNIKFDIKYEYKDKIDVKDLKSGENILKLNKELAVNGSYASVSLGADNALHRNIGALDPSQNGTTALVHETGHFIGLIDRYTDIPGGKKSDAHKGYENDIMGSGAPHMVQEHYDDFANLALEQLRNGNTTFVITNYFDRNRKSNVKKDETKQ